MVKVWIRSEQKVEESTGLVRRMQAWRWDDERSSGSSRKQLWIAHSELPRTVGHPFYERLNELLEERKFDEFVEVSVRAFMRRRWGVRR